MTFLLPSFLPSLVQCSNAFFFLFLLLFFTRKKYSQYPIKTIIRTWNKIQVLLKNTHNFSTCLARLKESSPSLNSSRNNSFRNMVTECCSIRKMAGSWIDPRARHRVNSPQRGLWTRERRRGREKLKRRAEIERVTGETFPVASFPRVYSVSWPRKWEPLLVNAESLWIHSPIFRRDDTQLNTTIFSPEKSFFREIGS